MPIGTLEIILKIAIAAALGGIVGAERESVLKQHLTGLKTFALVAVLGGLAGAVAYLLAPSADLIPIIGLIAVAAYAYSIFKKKGTSIIGMTTLSLMPIIYLIGLMAGFGMLQEAAAAEFIVLTILALRRSLRRKEESLDEKEINQMIQFGLILFVIFPLLPQTPVVIGGIAVDFLMLFGFILFVSLLNLLAFLVHRIFKTDTSTMTGFIGGIINSSITIHDIAKRKKDGEWTAGQINGATAAMLGSIARNTLLAAIVMPDIFILLAPLFAIIATAMIVLIYMEKKARKSPLSVEQTFEMISGVKLALMLLAILIAFQLVAKNLPEFVPLLSLVSGAVSSGYTMLSLGTVYYEIGMRETIASVAFTIIGSFLTSTAVAFIYGSKKFGIAVLRLSVIAAVLLLGYVFIIAA